jgi:PAS domain S-box-containing protein
MSHIDGHDEAGLEELRRQIADLRAALNAISEGGVDAVVVGDEGREQIYTLTSADRPYRVIVESMGEGAATISARGVILFANSQLSQILGVPGDAMIGRDIGSLVDEDQRETLAALLADRSSHTRRGELSLTRGDGTPVPFLVAATDIDLDGVLVHCLVFTDLTMQKLLEQRLAAEAAQAERQRVAHEVNDTIVQGLVAAEMALDLDQIDFARTLVASTSRHARSWIGDLSGGQPLEPGQAVRRTPARAHVEGS